LGWTHLRQIICLDDPLQRELYAEMCRMERWNTRTLNAERDLEAAIETDQIGETMRDGHANVIEDDRKPERRFLDRIVNGADLIREVAPQARPSRLIQENASATSDFAAFRTNKRGTMRRAS
jgi:hypothetical protein